MLQTCQAARGHQLLLRIAFHRRARRKSHIVLRRVQNAHMHMWHTSGTLYRTRCRIDRIGKPVGRAAAADSTRAVARTRHVTLR